jgi:hypothetical protein
VRGSLDFVESEGLKERFAKWRRLTGPVVEVGKGDMGYGDVNLDSPTVQAMGWLTHVTKQLVAESDALKATNARLSAIAAERDQLKAELDDLKEKIRRAWMPAKSRRKLTPAER